MERINKEMMESMIENWMIDNAEEMTDLEIDKTSIRMDEDSGRWECDAQDNKHTYVLQAVDGDITINYTGTR